MNDKNKIDKTKRMAIKIIVFVIATLLILALYRSLSKTDHNVSKEDVFSVSVESEDYEIDSQKDISGIVKDDSENNDTGSSPNKDSNIGDNSEDNSDEKSDNSENEESEETEDTDIDTLPTPKTAPDLTGMDEATAISTCTQNGYKYSVEYYLGGNGTVISQLPTSSENIEPGGSIAINIGISQSEFSNRLLALINEKRRSSGLGELNFSEQLNTACSILAQENVNSVDCTRPNGSHWSTVLDEISFQIYPGILSTRSNITTLSDANGKIKYQSNIYSEENLLTPSFNIIGMAYSSNNMLVIIVGCQ